LTFHHRFFHFLFTAILRPFVLHSVTTYTICSFATVVPRHLLCVHSIYLRCSTAPPPTYVAFPFLTVTTYACTTITLPFPSVRLPDDVTYRSTYGLLRCVSATTHHRAISFHRRFRLHCHRAPTRLPHVIYLLPSGRFTFCLFDLLPFCSTTVICSTVTLTPPFLLCLLTILLLVTVPLREQLFADLFFVACYCSGRNNHYHICRAVCGAGFVLLPPMTLRHTCTTVHCSPFPYRHFTAFLTPVTPP